ncbi:MAG: Flp pilus assembly protein CpaB [Chloroflexi bacterium]|nr:Flp pilus assembly protein CpaB [Chloroflexota bacterium]
MSRLRGFLWLLAGLTVAFLAAVVAYMTLSRAARVSVGEVRVEGAVQQVVVTSQAVPVRTLLTAEMLTTQELPVATVPTGAVTEIEQAVGKLTLAELFAGEVLLEQRLVDPDIIAADGRTAVAMNAEQVLMAVPASDLMSQVAVLKPGDKVDILVSMTFPRAAMTAEGEQEEEMVTYILLQNVTIAALPGATFVTAGAEGQAANQPPQPPNALLVTLVPQDALVLKYALDSGAIQDVVLRAPGADQEWEFEPVDIDYVIDAYRIPVR